MMLKTPKTESLPQPARFAVPPAARATAVDLAARLFAGSAREEEIFDVESERTYIVVSVEMQGEPSEVVDRELKWHEELERLIGPDEFHFRLSITAKR